LHTFTLLALVALPTATALAGQPEPFRSTVQRCHTACCPQHRRQRVTPTGSEMHCHAGRKLYLPLATSDPAAPKISFQRQRTTSRLMLTLQRRICSRNVAFHCLTCQVVRPTASVGHWTNDVGANTSGNTAASAAAAALTQPATRR
jgi:hypothetical protein